MNKILLFFALVAMGFMTVSCNEDSAYDNHDEDTVADDNMADDDMDMHDESTDAGEMNPLKISPQEFVDRVTKDNMTEIESAKWAVNNVTNADVKGYAQMLVAEHQGANAKLKSLAGQKNYTVPTVVDDKQHNHLQNLSKKTGMEADKEFVDMMVKDHKNAIDYFERAIKEVEDQDVVNYAREVLPKLRTHLQKAEQLQNMLKDKS